MLDPLFDAIGGIAGDLDGVSPTSAASARIRRSRRSFDLLIDRIEDHGPRCVRRREPAFRTSASLRGHSASRHVSLGSVVLPFSKVFSVLRDAIGALGFYESELNGAVGAYDGLREVDRVEDKQTQTDDAAADRARLEAIRGDFIAATKSVTIVNLRAVTGVRRRSRRQDPSSGRGSARTWDLRRTSKPAC